MMKVIREVVGVQLVPPDWIKGKDAALMGNIAQECCLVTPFSARCPCYKEVLEVWVLRKHRLSFADSLGKPSQSAIWVGQNRPIPDARPSLEFQLRTTQNDKKGLLF